MVDAAASPPDDEAPGLTPEQLGLPSQKAAPTGAPAPTQTAPAPGSEGRTVTVRARPAPKPPPAPIAPHPSVPLAVQPAVLPPDAEGQKPPPDEDEPPGLTPEQAGVKKYPGLGTDILKGAASGLSEGITGIAGMPHDLPKLADYGVDWAAAHLNQMTGGENAEDVLKRTHGSAIRGAFGDKVADAIETFSPTSYWPSAATLQGAAEKAIPALGYKPQSLPGRYAHEISAFLPGALIPGGEASLGARALQAGSAAIGSETLGNMVQGTGYEPWARFLGAGLGGLTHAGISDYTAPIRKSGQADMAAALAQKEATDPTAALAKLRAEKAQTPPGRATGENIPGSEPTPGQITGDYGQIRAERAFQAGLGQAIYGQRVGEQSAAQTKATRAIQPTGDPQSVSDLITQRLADIDKKHEADVASALTAHSQKGAALEAQARTEAGQVARRGDPEALGEAARKPLAESLAKAHAEEKRLWNAIDPHNKIGVWTNQVAAQARNVAKRVGPMQRPMEGDEKRIFDNAANNLPRWTKLSDVTDLRSDLTTTMRKERIANGSTPALKRMTGLLKTIDNVIKNNATRSSAKEAQETMEGLRRMTPEDREAAMKASAASRARGEIERGPAGAIVRKGATSDSYRTMASQVPGKVFAAGPTGGQKLKAYTAAGGTMDPVHDIVSDSLAREATTDGMIDAKKLTTWQEKHRPALESLPDQTRQKFLGGPNQAGQALAEGAAARRTALIDHNKRDVAKEMGASASAADRADPAFKGIIGKESAKDVQAAVGGILQRPDAVTTITRLAKAVSGNANAEDGLKRAVLDHVLEKTMSTAEAGTERENMLKPGAFQTFVANNKAALKAAGLSDEQVGAFEKVAADLQRQQRFNATKTRAGSDTAQNWFKLKGEAEAHHNAGWLAPILAVKEAYEMTPEFLHNWAGAGVAAMGVGAWKVLSRYRNKGIDKAKDLYHEAVMDPDQMANLLARPSPGSMTRLTRTLKRSAMYGGLAAERHEALGPRGNDIYVNKSAANP